MVHTQTDGRAVSVLFGWGNRHIVTSVGVFSTSESHFCLCDLKTGAASFFSRPNKKKKKKKDYSCNLNTRRPTYSLIATVKIPQVMLSTFKHAEKDARLLFLGRIAPHSCEVDAWSFYAHETSEKPTRQILKCEKTEQPAYLPFLRHWWSTSFSLLCYSVTVGASHRTLQPLSTADSDSAETSRAARSAHDPAHAFHYHRLPEPARAPPTHTHTHTHTHKHTRLPSARPSHTSPLSLSLSQEETALHNCTVELLWSITVIPAGADVDGEERWSRRCGFRSPTDCLQSSRQKRCAVSHSWSGMSVPTHRTCSEDLCRVLWVAVGESKSSLTSCLHSETEDWWRASSPGARTIIWR